MSVDLGLLMVDKRIIDKYGDDPMLNSVWWSRFILDVTEGLSNADALSAAKVYVENEFAKDSADVWPNLERLIKEGNLPGPYLCLSSEWQRLDIIFGRELNQAKRQLLRSAFYGVEEIKVPLEVSYGKCKIVPSEDAVQLAAALKELTLSELTAYPKENTDQDLKQELDTAVEQLSKSIPELNGIDLGEMMKEVKISPDLLNVADQIGQYKRDLVPEEWDMTTLSRVSKFYENAAKRGGTVICGII